MYNFAGSCTGMFPPNVTVSFNNPADTDGRYRAGTNARISCDEGYELYGSSTVTCGSY